MACQLFLSDILTFCVLALSRDEAWKKNTTTRQMDSIMEWLEEGRGGERGGGEGSKGGRRDEREGSERVEGVLTEVRPGQESALHSSLFLVFPQCVISNKTKIKYFCCNSLRAKVPLNLKQKLGLNGQSLSINLRPTSLFPRLCRKFSKSFASGSSRQMQRMRFDINFSHAPFHAPSHTSSCTQLFLSCSLFFVLDAPHVGVELGKSISPNTVYEGGDVYFDCKVEALPPSHKITWIHNVS